MQYEQGLGGPERAHQDLFRFRESCIDHSTADHPACTLLPEYVAPEAHQKLFLKSPTVPAMFEVYETAHETFPWVGTGDPVYRWASAGKSAQQSVPANAPDNWHWYSFDEQSLIPDCASISYSQTSLPTSKDLYGHRAQESSELLYRPAAYAHRNIIGSQPGFAMHSGGLYPSSSAITHSAEVPQDSDFGVTFTNNTRVDRRSSFVATNPARTLLAMPSAASKRRGRQRNECLYTCGKNTPLSIGKNKRPAREIIEDICRMPALLPDGSERLLKLVEAFEKMYHDPKAARGYGDARTKALRQNFRNSVTRLFVHFSRPDRQNVHYYSKPLVNIARLEVKRELFHCYEKELADGRKRNRYGSCGLHGVLGDQRLRDMTVCLVMNGDDREENNKRG